MDLPTATTPPVNSSPPPHVCQSGGAGREAGGWCSRAEGPVRSWVHPVRRGREIERNCWSPSWQNCSDRPRGLGWLSGGPGWSPGRWSAAGERRPWRAGGRSDGLWSDTGVAQLGTRGRVPAATSRGWVGQPERRVRWRGVGEPVCRAAKAVAGPPGVARWVVATRAVRLFGRLARPVAQLARRGEFGIQRLPSCGWVASRLDCRSKRPWLECWPLENRRVGVLAVSAARPVGRWQVRLPRWREEGQRCRTAWSTEGGWWPGWRGEFGVQQLLLCGWAASRRDWWVRRCRSRGCLLAGWPWRAGCWRSGSRGWLVGWRGR